MFEPVSRKKVTAGVKIIVASVVVVLLSLGLCGLESVITRNGFGILGDVGAGLFVASLIGFLVGILVTILQGIASLSGRKEGQ